jgi:hypothetical protein
MVEFATRIFNLARAGDTPTLASYLDTGGRVGQPDG